MFRLQSEPKPTTGGALIDQISHIIFLGNILLVFGAALQDVFTRRISNWLCAAMAVLGLSYTVINDSSHWAQHLGATLLVFLAVLILFQRKFFGGGDAKMIIALSLWFVAQQLPLFVLWTLMCGGVAGVAYLSRTVIMRMIKKDWHVVSGVPYGVAIAGGYIVAVGQVVAR